MIPDGAIPSAFHFCELVRGDLNWWAAIAKRVGQLAVKGGVATTSANHVDLYRKRYKCTAITNQKNCRPDCSRRQFSLIPRNYLFCVPLSFCTSDSFAGSPVGWPWRWLSAALRSSAPLFCSSNLFGLPLWWPCFSSAILYLMVVGEPPRSEATGCTTARSCPFVGGVQ